MRYKYIVWDWNGTLLDDMVYGLELTNVLLRDMGLVPLTGLGEYRERFGFPVRDYYADLGIGPDRFVAAAHRWMDAYMAGETACPLQPGALEVTQKLQGLGAEQIIVSASKQELLEEQLKTRSIIRERCPAYGIRDIYASSKEALALQIMESLSWPRNETVFVGDTLHDAQVAAAVGCDCILVANGHQSMRRLMKTGAQVCEDLYGVLDFILRE